MLNRFLELLVWGLLLLTSSGFLDMPQCVITGAVNWTESHRHMGVAQFDPVRKNILGVHDRIIPYLKQPITDDLKYIDRTVF